MLKGIRVAKHKERALIVSGGVSDNVPKSFSENTVLSMLARVEKWRNTVVNGVRCLSDTCLIVGYSLASDNV